MANIGRRTDTEDLSHASGPPIAQVATSPQVAPAFGGLMYRALACVVPLTALFVSLAAPASPAGAATTNPVPNPSFEVVSGGRPVSWAVRGDPGSVTTIVDARAGRAAAKLRGKAGNVGTVELVTTQSATSGLALSPGRRYSIGAWYRAATPISVVAYTRDAAGRWKRWYRSAPFAGSTPWARAEAMTPPVPAGTSAVSVGLSVAGYKWLDVDDVSIMAATTSADAGTVLFNPTFPTVDGLVTNEYAYRNPTSTDAVRSDVWEMTSGSLFAAGGSGYTGPLTVGRPDALSTTATNSAVFRLRSIRDDFDNVTVSSRFFVEAFESTVNTPEQAFDGVHMWVRYQSEYNLYVASVSRRDGVVVIKKKCAGGVSNDGTYHALHKAVPGWSGTPDQWWTATTSVQTNPTGTVTITVAINGTQVVAATDTGVGCAPITGTGRVGVRADNTRFKFNDFTTTAN